MSNFHRFQNGQGIKIRKVKKTNVKYIRNGIQYNSADAMIPPVPKYKSPPPRGKKRAIAITHVEPDDEIFEREETPERANLLPIKRISKNSRQSA